MGFWARLKAIMGAKANKALDRAENPAETLDYSYQRQLEMLQQMKRGVAEVVTAKKRLELQSDKLEQSVVKLDDQARKALAGQPRGPGADGAGAQGADPGSAAGSRPAGEPPLQAQQEQLIPAGAERWRRRSRPSAPRRRS